MSSSTRFLASTLLVGSMVLPLSASAATYLNARTLVISEPSTENLYLSGTDVTLAVPVEGDVIAAGGTVTLAGDVDGDATLAGGTVSVDRRVTGDVRIVGAQVVATGAIDGDLAVAAGSVTASTSARDMRIIAGTVRVTGSGGDVTIYGADIQLSGVFDGDIEILASDRLTVAEGTVVNGSLRYDAPQQVVIPASATISEGVVYTGSSSFLPTVEQAKTFAIAGASVLFVVRILAVLIAASLLAGLFPVFSQMVADKTLAHTPGRFALLALLGFAVLFATPVLILLLLISFVGIGVAFPLLAGYLLLLMIGYLYAGVITGAALGRGLMKRTTVTWRLALLGMLALSLIGTVPAIGSLVVFVLFLASLGAITAIAYRHAFGSMAESYADTPVE